jgi:hypothetical protein
MLKLSDLYKPRHKADAEKQLKATEEAALYRKKLKEIGRACMSDPKFRKYKENFQALERLTFNQARNHREADPIKYAMTISNMFSELNALEALIGDVESDANTTIGDKNA